jgi:large repetitive protein
MLKKILSIIFIVLCINFLCQNAYGQMRQVYLDTSIANNNIRKVSFYTASQGWIAGYDNAATWVAYTSDSGHTLVKKFITTNNVNFNGNSVNITFGFDVAGVKAINQNTIIVYGDYGLVPSILYSTNGGNSFTLVYHSQYNNLQLSGGITDMVFPENNTTGFATDADRILKTSNGGQTWVTLKDDAQSFYENIEAIDNNNIFAYSKRDDESKIVKTIN